MSRDLQCIGVLIRAHDHGSVASQGSGDKVGRLLRFHTATVSKLTAMIIWLFLNNCVGLQSLRSKVLIEIGVLFFDNGPLRLYPSSA